MQFRATNNTHAIGFCYSLFFYSLRFDWEHIFGSKYLSYVLESDSLIVEISDEICLLSDAGLRLQRFGISEEQGKCRLSSVHFSKGEHKELVDL